MTEYYFNGKPYTFNTQEAYAMGKDAFMAAHKHVPNVGDAWNKVEADANPDARQTKVEGPAKTKIDKPKNTK